MGLFNKGVDIDFTEMQKRGLIKKQSLPESENVKVNSQGFVEFSQGPPMSGSPGAVASPAPANSSPFGFLDNPAPSTSFFDTSVSPTVTPSVSASEAPEFSNLKIQVDNLDFKISNLIDRLGNIERKLLDFENKTQNFRV